MEVASSAGLEPATHCLEGSCSNPTELRGVTQIISQAIELKMNNLKRSTREIRISINF